MYYGRCCLPRNLYILLFDLLVNNVCCCTHYLFITLQFKKTTNNSNAGFCIPMSGCYVVFPDRYMSRFTKFSIFCIVLEMLRVLFKCVAPPTLVSNLSFDHLHMAKLFVYLEIMTVVYLYIHLFSLSAHR